MKRVHYTDSYLMNPQHPVTVNIIGAGGTGSQVLTCMARLDVTLRALGHPGLFVTLYDPDIVTEANIGRQLFGPMDLGLNKAQCLVTRINNFFGNDWKAEARLYPSVLKEVKRDEIANITITCTDNIKSRLDLWNVLGKVPPSSYTDNNTPLYWMDFREHTDFRAGCAGNCAEENQTTGFHAIRNGRFPEGHHPLRKICEGKRRRFRTELFVGGGIGETGFVHQLHAGTTRMQYPLENVPEGLN